MGQHMAAFLYATGSAEYIHPDQGNGTKDSRLCNLRAQAFER